MSAFLHPIEQMRFVLNGNEYNGTTRIKKLYGNNNWMNQNPVIPTVAANHRFFFLPMMSTSSMKKADSFSNNRDCRHSLNVSEPKQSLLESNKTVIETSEKWTFTSQNEQIFASHFQSLGWKSKVINSAVIGKAPNRINLLFESFCKMPFPNASKLEINVV